MSSPRLVQKPYFSFKHAGGKIVRPHGKMGNNVTFLKYIVTPLSLTSRSHIALAFTTVQTVSKI